MLRRVNFLPTDKNVFSVRETPSSSSESLFRPMGALGIAGIPPVRQPDDAADTGISDSRPASRLTAPVNPNFIQSCN